MKPYRKTIANACLAALLMAASAAHAQTTSTTGQPFAVELAKASLAEGGNETPTQEQIDGAVQAIETQRASGMGWGEIANSLGLHLGHVISAYARSKNSDDAVSTSTQTKTRVKARDDGRAEVERESETETERHAFSERGEKTERAEKAERTEKAERSERSERSESRGGKGR